MRLDSEQQRIIIDTVRQFDADAVIRLFGSRADNDARGGDIDLLVESHKISYREKLIIRYQLKKKLGERKIDLIITGQALTAFTQMIRKKSQLL